jgi:hypothetical protein
MLHFGMYGTVRYFFATNSVPTSGYSTDTVEYHLNFADFDKKNHVPQPVQRCAHPNGNPARNHHKLLTHGSHFFEHMTKHGATSIHIFKMAKRIHEVIFRKKKLCTT